MKLLLCNAAARAFRTRRVLVVWAQINIIEPCVLDITKGNYMITAGLNKSESLNSQKSLITIGDSCFMVWPGLLSYTTKYRGWKLYITIYMFTLPLENTCRLLFSFNMLYCQHRIVLQSDKVIFFYFQLANIPCC